MVLHLKALIATLGVLFTTLLWVKGVYGASVLFYISMAGVGYVTFTWLRDFTTEMNQMKKQGLMLGAFGVAMFLFSYAMVPLYHIICHGSSSIEASVTNHPLEVDIMYEQYRAIPVAVSISKKRLSLTSKKSEVIYVTLENQSVNPIELKMTIASQPRTLKPYFGLVTPEVIALGPRQRTQFPVEVKFLSEVPDDLWQTALLFLFQDINAVGELGKTSSWKKMHGYHDHHDHHGVR